MTIPDEEKAPILRPTASSTNSDEKQKEFVSYGWRWINLVLFCALSAAQNFLGFAFAPIANIVVEYYEETGKITTAHVNFLNAVTLLTAIPLFIWGPPVITRHTLRASMIFLVIVDILGGVLRYIFSGPTMLDYWFVFVGQAIMSLGQLVTWAGPTKLAMVWFPDKERAIATSLGSMSNLLGIATAYLLCPIIVPDDQPNEVKTLLLIQMIVCIALGVLCLLFFRSSPPSAPSKSSQLNLLDADGVEEELPEGIEPPPQGCWGQYKALVSSFSFDVVAICFGLGFGYFNGLFTVMNSMMTPLGYSGSEVGLFGVLLIVSGVVGAAVSGVVVGRTHKFKEVTVVCLFFSCFAMLYFALSVKEDNLANICASLCCLGFSALAITPVALEVSVEYTYPIPVTTSSGALCAWGSFLAVVMIVIMTVFVDIAHWLGVGGFVVTFFFSLLMGKNYKRQKLDSS